MCGPGLERENKGQRLGLGRFRKDISIAQIIKSWTYCKYKHADHVMSWERCHIRVYLSFIQHKALK